MLVNPNSNHLIVFRWFEIILGGIKELSWHDIVITVFFQFYWQAPNQPKTKMKFIIVFALCIVAALAAPADVSITKEAFETPSDAGYKFA